MNQERDQAARVSALVRKLRRDVPDEAPADRPRLHAAVEEALRGRRRQRVRVRWLARGAALAAGLALVTGGLALRERQSLDRGVNASLRPEEAPAPAGVLPGTRVVAPPGGEVRVGTATGTNLTLERGGELAVVEAGTTQRFALDHGAVRAHVTKLAAGRRFIIQTAEAEVEVHGTRFRVALVDSDPGCGAGTRTRVSVDEGVVTVRAAGQSMRILPGGHWPANCAPETPSVAPPSIQAVTVAPAPRSRVHKPRRPAVPEAALEPASDADSSVIVNETEMSGMSAADVADQNRRYADALRAKREGDVGGALRRFGALLAAYPHGPLAESAMVQRMNLLQTVGGPAASRAAADYLSRFPNGFARAEARRLLTAPAP